MVLRILFSAQFLLFICCNITTFLNNNKNIITNDCTAKIWNSDTKCEATFQIDNDSAFKIWISDTMHLLTSNLRMEKNSSFGLDSTMVQIGDDSLSLEILRKYELTINCPDKNKPKQHVDKNVSAIIELLKTYDELPNKQFKLKFTRSDYYSASEDDNLNYDKIEEFRDIQTSFINKTIFYTYIRGRLNDKKVVEKINGKEVIKQYNFIWNGNHLTKQEL